MEATATGETRRVMKAGAARATATATTKTTVQSAKMLATATATTKTAAIGEDAPGPITVRQQPQF